MTRWSITSSYSFPVYSRTGEISTYIVSTPVPPRLSKEQLALSIRGFVPNRNQEYHSTSKFKLPKLRQIVPWKLRLPPTIHAREWRDYTDKEHQPYSWYQWAHWRATDSISYRDSLSQISIVWGLAVMSGNGYLGPRIPTPRICPRPKSGDVCYLVNRY